MCNLAREIGAAVSVLLVAIGSESIDQALTREDPSSFARGRTLFERQFTGADGLGPAFNASSCAFCHKTPSVGGSGRGPETLVDWAYNQMSGELGEPQQRFALDDQGRNISMPRAAHTRRRPPTLFGLGDLEAVSINQLRSATDSLDVDGDGISGRLPWREDCYGRFGWQSTVCDIQTFVVGALNNELGIVTFPRSRREISLQDVADLSAFVRGLPPPPAPTSEVGAELFERAQCAACHRPVTGTAVIEGTQREVRAYTDLLLHEMGNRPLAKETDSRTEFRTPALWGVGATAPYLHDGSAPTLEDAILRHRGEASEARRRFAALSPDARQRLLRFVRTR